MVQAERRARKQVAERFYATPKGREVLNRTIAGNQERSRIQPTVYPFALRGFPVNEITLITGFSVTQVERAIRNFREKGEANGGLRRPLREESIALQVHAVTGIKRGKPREYTRDQLNTAAFIKKLQEAGLITNGLSNWNELVELYKQSRRSMPREFTTRLRLEIFYAARKAIDQGEPELLLRYAEIGESISPSDPGWFDRYLAEEEEFVMSAMPVQGFNEDARGFFQVQGTAVWRPVVLEEDRLIDNMRLFTERQRNRDGELRHDLPSPRNAPKKRRSLPVGVPELV